VSRWPATRAARVYGALLRIGWQLKRQGGGSHRVLAREGDPDFV
jgi:predicted RNA binding protein YcfA (HicA-like mRNA interferase family)